MNDNNQNDREIESTIFSVDPLVCQTTGWGASLCLSSWIVQRG